MRKVKYGIIILLNYIYVPLKCILSGFYFHATLPQLITPGTKIEMGGGWPHFLICKIVGVFVHHLFQLERMFG